MTAKGRARRARREAAAAGRPWNVELGPDGAQIVRERTSREERRHERAMERWARRAVRDGAL